MRLYASFPLLAGYPLGRGRGKGNGARRQAPPHSKGCPPNNPAANRQQARRAALERPPTEAAGRLEPKLLYSLSLSLRQENGSGWKLKPCRGCSAAAPVTLTPPHSMAVSDFQRSDALPPRKAPDRLDSPTRPPT